MALSTHLSCNMVRLAEDTVVVTLIFKTSRGMIKELKAVLYQGQTRHLSEQITVSWNQESLHILVEIEGYYKVLWAPVTSTQQLEWKCLEKRTALLKKTAHQKLSASSIKN